MADQLKALGLLYAQPFRAIGLILDRGRLSIAIVLALVAGLLFAYPVILQSVDTSVGPEGFPQDEVAQTGHVISISSLFSPIALSLILLAAVFVPIAVIVVNKLEGTGSAGVVLPRDYMPMLVCHLAAYTAALLPAAVIEFLIPGVPPLAVPIAMLLYFAFLSVCIVRTVSGTSFGRAIGTEVVAVIGAFAGLYLYSFVQGAMYFLASPFVLYYLYIMFGQGIGSEMRSIGSGLSSRQRMRKLFETATVNPRDADARYQLGLIYQQRRDFAQAEKWFEEAVSIDKQEPEAQYQLGRVLRARGNFAEALQHLKAAAAIDSKIAQSEVLRETGATLLDLGRNDEARDVLLEFTNRRNFDPEGWHWLGVALARLRDATGAREAFQQSIEAVRTAPAHRRRQIAQWASASSKQLRQLPS